MKRGTSTKKKLKLWSSKRADIEFSKWIRARDKTCFFCRNQGTQNSHFWGRQISATRYSPENCDAICGGCHMRHESSKQGLYREKKIKQLGMDGYTALRELAFQSHMNRAEAIKELMKLLA